VSLAQQQGLVNRWYQRKSCRPAPHSETLQTRRKANFNADVTDLMPSGTAAVGY
jgi:hypothetical protein